jgi:hypothetical protein
MSDVVSFPPPPPPRAPSLKDKLGHHDAFCLKLCAEWRVARAQIAKDWAEQELATLWGTSDAAMTKHSDTRPLDPIEDLENLLAQAKPRTALLARELLRVALAILASEHEDLDLENRLAMAPAIEILRNVAAALDDCEPGMRIGP